MQILREILHAVDCITVQQMIEAAWRQTSNSSRLEDGSNKTELGKDKKSQDAANKLGSRGEGGSTCDSKMVAVRR